MLCAPLIFAPLQALTWLLWSWLNPAEVTGLAAALALAAYGLLFGYIYAGLSIFAFFVAVRIGFVSRFPLVESSANVA